MTMQDFNITFWVDQKPKEVFDSINNVRAWWSEELEGSSHKLNDEFSYRHGEAHYSKHRLIEVVEDKKVVWLIIDSKLTFVQTQDEWTGTRVVFEISRQNGKTKLAITHIGLVPTCECYEGCSKGWTHYLQESLLPLITTGQGKPDKKQVEH